MDDIRTQITTALNEITSVESGVPIPDDMVEDGKTYFGFELQETHIDGDQENNYTMEITLTGRIVRKVDKSGTENTIQVVDEALEDIKAKLKTLNFKYNYNDISQYTDDYRKILVKAYVKYNELIRELV